MEIKITNEKRIKDFRDEIKELCKKHNMFPKANFDLVRYELEYVYYNLDKMTPEEIKGDTPEKLWKRSGSETKETKSTQVVGLVKAN